MHPINYQWTLSLHSWRYSIHSVNALFFIFRYRMLKVRQLQHLTSLSENRGWVLIVAPLSTAILGLYFNQHCYNSPLLLVNILSCTIPCRPLLFYAEELYAFNSLVQELMLHFVSLIMPMWKLPIAQYQVNLRVVVSCLIVNGHVFVIIVHQLPLYLY